MSGRRLFNRGSFKPYIPPLMAVYADRRNLGNMETRRAKAYVRQRRRSEARRDDDDDEDESLSPLPKREWLAVRASIERRRQKVARTKAMHAAFQRPSKLRSNPKRIRATASLSRSTE